MRHRWVIGALCIALAVSAALALPAGSQQPPERGTITLFDPNRTDFERFIDRGRQGPSPGDTILFVDRQFDPDTCERAGRLIGRLVISRAFQQQEDAWFIGDFTLQLTDGKVIAAAAARFSDFEQSEEAIFAVTGGTGAYRDASGEIFIQEDVQMCDKRGALTTIDIGPQQ